MSGLTALDRVRRLLAIIPWVASEGGMSLDEMASRFDYPRETLLEDLWSVVQMVGVAPFGPGDMLGVLIEDDWVSIDYDHWFVQPMTLRPDEVVRLRTAAQAVADLAATEDLGPLERAATKLAAFVEPEATSTVDVRLGVVDEEVLGALQGAVAGRLPVEMDYYSYARDVPTTRTVEPHRLLADGGHWYLTGHCRLAEAPRIFRLDRISRCEVGEDPFPEPEQAAAGPEGFLDHGDFREVQLILEPDVRWVISQYPHRESEVLEDGRLRVRLAVASTAWMERLLLRLGLAATIEEAPVGLGEDLRRAAARRVLGRYRP